MKFVTSFITIRTAWNVTKKEKKSTYFHSNPNLIYNTMGYELN
jgi:hypothetical protein